MHRLGKYTASDRMSDLVCGNYHILLIMSRFGIALGFGDRTVDEVCCQSGVDTATFLAVVNLLYDEGTTTVDCRNVSLEAFLRYLHNSHDYFLQYRLPDIRRKLSEAVACGRDGIAEAIIRFFDDYAAEVHKHMMYEEETVFPYVRQLLTGECPAGIRHRNLPPPARSDRSQTDGTEKHTDQILSRFGELRQGDERRIVRHLSLRIRAGLP